MPTDWIKQINDALYALGTYPDLEACVVQGNAEVLVLEDADGYTVYEAPAAVMQTLQALTPPPDALDDDMWALVVEALGQHVLLPDQAARVTWHDHAGYCWS